MQHCPACGAANDDDDRFCRECRTRLPSAPPLRPMTGASRPVSGTARRVGGEAPARAPADRGAGLSTASLVLGLLGLGPAAVACGVVALRRGRPGRMRALAGVVLGATGSLILLGILLTPRPAPDLDSELVPGRIAGWVRLVEAHCDELEARADRLQGSLGGLLEQDIEAAYDLIADIRLDLGLARLITDPEELDRFRADILFRLEQCGDILARY